MSLSFKERLALRAAGGTAPLTVDESVEQPAVIPMSTETKPVRKFGAPKDEPKDTTANGEPGGAETSPPATESKAGGTGRFGFSYDAKGDSAAAPGDSVPVRRFGAGSTTQATPAEGASATQVAVRVQEDEAAPLPKVIQAFNAVGSSQQVASNGQTEGELLSGKETPAAVRQIQQKIHGLSSLGEVDLRYEMVNLQGMLVANPSACLYLLDEDLGLAVRALRRMTNNRVAIDMASAKPSAKARAASSKPLTAAEMASAMDDL